MKHTEERSSTIPAVLMMLPDNWMTALDIEVRTGLCRKVVNTRLRRLVTAGKVIQSNRAGQTRYKWR